MVCDRPAAIGAGLAGLIDDTNEVSKVVVLEHSCEFPRGPELAAAFFNTLDPLKGVRGREICFAVHSSLRHLFATLPCRNVPRNGSLFIQTTRSSRLELQSVLNYNAAVLMNVNNGLALVA